MFSVLAGVRPAGVEWLSGNAGRALRRLRAEGYYGADALSAVCFMFLLVALCIHAQALEPPQTPETSPPVSVERIRRELEREREFDIAATVGDSTRQVFRVYINENLPLADRVWTAETSTPLYVRTQWPLYHHEFLAKVTPDEFRAGTLYPIGIDLVAVADFAVTRIRKALRSGAEARARSVVRKELASLLEAGKAEGEKDR